MRIRLIAVGTRMSAWVDAAVADYARRLRGAAALELIEVPMARRSGGTDPMIELMFGEAKRPSPAPSSIMSTTRTG